MKNWKLNYPTTPSTSILQDRVLPLAKDTRLQDTRSQDTRLQDTRSLDTRSLDTN